MYVEDTVPAGIQIVLACRLSIYSEFPHNINNEYPSYTKKKQYSQNTNRQYPCNKKRRSNDKRILLR